MLSRVPIALLFVAAAGCTTASAPQRAASAADSSEGAKGQLICRDMTTTGTIGPRHACHTAEQWKKINALD